MATIEKRGSRWCVRYQARDALGNVIGQKRVSGFLTKEDAMAAARDLERKTDAGVDVHGASKTCGEIMERWFFTKVDKVQETTLSKYSAYMDILQTRPVYTTRIRQLSQGSLKAIIDDLIETRGISSASAFYYTEPLRLSLTWATQNGMISMNPLTGCAKPRSEPAPLKILSDQDILDLVQVCQDNNPSFLIPLYLGLYGGLRREEAAALEWSNVDFRTGFVTILEALTCTQSGKLIRKEPKTKGSKRSVSLPDFVLTAMKEARLKQPPGTSYVCMSSRKCRYALSSYSHAVNDLVDHVNASRPADKQMPRISYHDLRHTHAAMLIRLGVQPKVIQERLGHASIKITMDTYGYLMPGMQEHVADVLDQAWSESGQKVGNALGKDIC